MPPGLGVDIPEILASSPLRPEASFAGLQSLWPSCSGPGKGMARQRQEGAPRTFAREGMPTFHLSGTSGQVPTSSDHGRMVFEEALICIFDHKSRSLDTF